MTEGNEVRYALARVCTDLDDVSNEIRQDLVLLYLLAIVSDLFLHNVLFVLQPHGFRFHDLRGTDQTVNKSVE